MSAKITAAEDTMKVSLSGKFDAVSAPKTEEEITARLDGINSVIFDIGEISYISSAGLRVFIYISQLMEDKGGMKIVNVPSAVRSIFEVTGLCEMLDLEYLD